MPRQQLQMEVRLDCSPKDVSSWVFRCRSQLDSHNYYWGQWITLKTPRLKGEGSDPRPGPLTSSLPFNLEYRVSTYLQMQSGMPFLLPELIRLCSTEPKASGKSKKVICTAVFVKNSALCCVRSSQRRTSRASKAWGTSALARVMFAKGRPTVH